MKIKKKLKSKKIKNKYWLPNMKKMKMDKNEKNESKKIGCLK